MDKQRDHELRTYSRWLCILALPLALALALASCYGSRFRDPYAGMGAAQISQDTLLRHAPAALPPDIDHDVRVLMDIRSVQDADAASRNDAYQSPGGGRIYYSWTVTGASQIW